MEEAQFTGQCLSKDFSLTLDTLADEVRHPAFPADQLERLRTQSISGLEQARQDTGGTGGAGAQASIAFAQALYPEGHPFWLPSLDQSETVVKALTAADLQGFYDKYYRPDTTTLVIVGDVKASEALERIKAAFGSWTKPAAPPSPYTIATLPLPAQAPPTKTIALPGASQTSILWGYRGQLKRSDPDFYPAYIANYILGGDTFGSRLGKTIRDQSGLAYSVGSSDEASHGAGPFEVFIGTNPNNAQRAVYELKQIAAQMRKSGVTADEVQQARLYLTGSYPLRLETNAGVAGQLLVAQDYGLGLDYIQKRSVIINAVTVAQVNAAIQKYLHPDKATLIFAGAPPAK